MKKKYIILIFIVIGAVFLLYPWWVFRMPTKGVKIKIAEAENIFDVDIIQYDVIDTYSGIDGNHIILELKDPPGNVFEEALSGNKKILNYGATKDNFSLRRFIEGEYTLYCENFNLEEKSDEIEELLFSVYNVDNKTYNSVNKFDETGHCEEITFMYFPDTCVVYISDWY